jgi:signal transduction histidine kinase
LQGFDTPLDVTYLSGLPTGDLEARLRSLPAHSMVFYILVDRDGAGGYFHPLQYLDRVSAASNAPVYSWVDSAIGHGVVGGHLKSQTAQIRAVADLALRVLRGEAADAIPVALRDLNEDEVDFRQVRRFGLSTAGLRPGTTILFRDLTTWERYRVYILTALVLLFAQTALIAGLLIQRNRRHRAERRVLQRESQLRASYARIRDLGARLLHEQDRERAHIARELHDDVSQQLALIEMDVKLLGAPDSDASIDLLARVQSLARSIRELSHRLHPAKLRLIGLVAALKGLQAEMSQAGLEIVFTHDGVPPSLPADVTLCLFRVAQEGLQNAVKYGRARRIELNLADAGDRIVLSVQDDGVGFDVGEAYGTGLGLVSMTERVEALAGTITVHSAAGAGTRIDASVPIAARKAGVIAV